MTLVLTVGQQQCLDAMGRDCEPLYHVRIESGITVGLRIQNYPQTGSSVVLSIDGVGTTVTWGLSTEVAGEDGTWGATLAEGLRRLDFDAWSKGNDTWLRLRNATNVVVGGTSSHQTLYIEPSVYEFVSGHRTIDNVPPSVLEVSPIARERDPMTNEVSLARRELLLEWNAITESMLTRNLLYGSRVIMTRGLFEFPLRDWVPSSVLIVADGPIAQAFGDAYTADLRERPPIRLMLEEPHERLVQVALETTPFFVQDLYTTAHPLERIQDIYQRAGIPIELTSFNPSHPQWSNVSHYAFTAAELFYSGFVSTAPIPDDVGIELDLAEFDSKELLDDLKQLAPAQIMAEEDGVTRARNISIPNIPVDWRHIFIATEPPESTRRDLLTSVEIQLNGGRVGDFSQIWPRGVRLTSTSANVAIGEFGRSGQNLVKISSKMLNSSSQRLQFDSSSLRFLPTDSVFVVNLANSFGFCGARSNRVPALAPSRFPGFTLGPGTVQAPPEWATLNEERIGYFLLYSPANRWAEVGGAFPEHYEVISADRVWTNLVSPEVTSPFLGSEAALTSRVGQTIDWGLSHAQYRVRQRALFGTTAADAWEIGASIQDITIPVGIAKRILSRYAWDFPIIRGETSLGELNVQLGDVVHIDMPHAVDFGGVGAEQAYIWQVIGKEETSFNIQWILMRMPRVVDFDLDLNIELLLAKP